MERWQSLSHTERKLYLRLRMLKVLMSVFLGCTCKSMAQIVHPLIKGQVSVTAFYNFIINQIYNDVFVLYCPTPFIL